MTVLERAAELHRNVASVEYFLGLFAYAGDVEDRAKNSIHDLSIFLSAFYTESHLCKVSFIPG